MLVFNIYHVVICHKTKTHKASVESNKIRKLNVPSHFGKKTFRKKIFSDNDNFNFNVIMS